MWELYYWPRSICIGRGEFVRLMFEDAGVPYKEMCKDMQRPKIKDLIMDGNLGGYPAFAPPLIKKGDFVLSQTPVICRYLGKEFGLFPDSEEDQWHAEQINVSIHDFIAEGRLAYHGVNPMASYHTQEEETKPYIERFVKERLPRHLTFLERVLKANDGGEGFVVGKKVTYVDLALLHVLRATEAQFPKAWQGADDIPALKAFKERISARPNLAAYFKSERCGPFAGDSMM